MVRNAGKDGEEQHYVYVLESVIVLSNGITLPFYSEFLTAGDMAPVPRKWQTWRSKRLPGRPKNRIAKERRFEG
ncbi:hypothetical protein QBE55_02780 [Eubacteriales bacterium mix99]|jgi:hypothetical protein